jgi:hypothetical protein
VSGLLERVKWVLIENRGADVGLLAEAVIREIETTHRIVDPEEITEAMIEACFKALPEHYDPPDPTRRPWHALKARRRYTAMVKAVEKKVRK